MSDIRQNTNSEINRSIHFLIVSKKKLGTIYDTFYSSVQLVLFRSFSGGVRAEKHVRLYVNCSFVSFRTKIQKI